jgi:catechol 1,2-dioxygenase
MKPRSRREFLIRGTYGAAGAALAALLFKGCGRVTPSSGALGGFTPYLSDAPSTATAPDFSSRPAEPAKFDATEDNILGPFYRGGAPFRGKVTPPMEPGNVLLILGRVWAADTKKPLAGAVLDVWQANAKGRYNNDDPKNPPAKNVYLNRARLITDEDGYYEYETIYPGKYLNGDQFRPAHIHYLVRAKGYKELITQLYFKGDPDNETDPFIKKSLIIELQKQKSAGGEFQAGVFNIVLAKA